jgi:hypothetical protein
MLMDSFEHKVHSFIVKLWLEEPATKLRSATWRGHITHVPGGPRRYVSELDQITAFIAPYLADMGVRTRWRRVHGWLRQRLTRRRPHNQRPGRGS